MLNRYETLSREKNRFIVKNQLAAMIVAVNSDTERTFTNSAIEDVIIRIEDTLKELADNEQQSKQ